MKISTEELENLYSQYRKKLLTVASAILNDTQKAEDAVQDTFIILTKQDYSKIEGHSASWLMLVCKRKAFKQYRKDTKLLVTDPQELEKTSTAKVNAYDYIEATAEYEQACDELREALNELSPRIKKLLDLRYFHEMSYKKIAEKMNISVTNAGFLLNQAKLKLKKILRSASI